MTPTSPLPHLECARCGETVPSGRLQGSCPQCSGPLLVRYDLPGLRASLDHEALSGSRASLDRDALPGSHTSQDPDALPARGGVWRFAPLLPSPGPDPGDFLTLGEGGTPEYPLPRLGEALGLSRLSLKDEGLNPTGTFKARGAAVGVAMARELGVRTIALPTAGNAGGAWAAYGARAGLEVVVAMPADTPKPIIGECLAFGARLELVDGLISDAGRWIAERAPAEGWFEAATLKEPYRIEGKKTMGLEIAQDRGWTWPDVILYPTGGGVGLIGIWKAMLELEALGWVRGERPRLVAVQAEGCRPIVDAWREGREESRFHEGARTLASGIRVPKASGDFLVLRALRETDGTAVAVSDEAIMDALAQVGRLEGVAVCPEGAACFAALPVLKESGWLDPEADVLVLNTGSGLKYPHLFPRP